MFDRAAIISRPAFEPMRPQPDYGEWSLRLVQALMVNQK